MTSDQYGPSPQVSRLASSPWLDQDKGDGIKRASRRITDVFTYSDHVEAPEKLSRNNAASCFPLEVG